MSAHEANKEVWGSPFPASTGWGWVLTYGVLLILGGILAFLNPLATGFAAGVIFGAILLAYGVIAIVAGLSAFSTRSKVLELLLGVVAVLAGIFVLFDPFQGAASLAWAIGLWLFVSGFSQLFYGLKGTHDQGWRLLLGVVDIGLGTYLVISGPLAGLAFVAAIIGFSFLFRGVFLISLAFGLRRLKSA
ncbi:DUF308 domain-containing protein [Sphingobium sp. PNB]|jgi:uncharacterized membrane protein HdeD (DUF308 family)|uniref:HdeD family acid-resistance protein n=1 Tax=Sphingobium sp. PNB TaxID=863934 RepID=UPI001CA46ACE|nr:DUF308 domain-containing protein [Sphingobium sp. PNB]MCB4863223.1 DUF308 domain-containing protein [Sphingobium sp. PNB]